MSKAALKKFIKFEESADDKTVKAAVMTKMEDEAASAMEGDDAYNYDDAANRLEEMAKAYEDANFAKDDDGEEPHVAMRRFASKFRRMGAPKLEQPAADEEKKKKDDEAFERTKRIELRAFATRMSIPVTETMSSKQLFDAIEASSVPSSKLPKLIDERVKEALAEEQRKSTAQTFEARAKELVATVPSMPDNQKAAILRLASDPLHFEAASGMVKSYLQSTGVTEPDAVVLMSRMTQGGAPSALSPQIARQSAPSAGSDSRIVSMDVLGQGARALVSGEKLSKATKELADSADPIMMAKVDRELEPGMKGSKYESFGRYQAAERILKKEQPALFEAAKTDQARLF